MEKESQSGPAKGGGGAKCELCRDGGRPADLSDSNVLFLQGRIAEGNLNEALDIARVAWNQFPRLKESADTKRMMEMLMEGLQEKMNGQVLVPISNTMTAMATIIDRLENLVETNPSLIEQGFNRTIEGFKTEMQTIRSAIEQPNAKISELSVMVNQLIYKPVAKGNAGENVLTDAWTEFFTKDEVVKFGGAGREDIVVTPFLTNGSARFGERIAIERKAGRQKYTGAHRTEAIAHAKEAGAPFAMIIYDSQDNLPLTLRPISLDRQDGIVTVVADMQSGGWKIARETIGVIQQAMYASSRDVSEINIAAVEEVVTELGAVVKAVDQIKGSNARIKSCADDVEQGVATIKALVKSYQDKLYAAVAGKDNGNGKSRIGAPGLA